MRETISIGTHKYNKRLWQIELKRRMTWTVRQEVEHKRVNEHIFILLSAKVLSSLYELGLTLLTRYQPFLLPLFLLLN